MVTISCFIMFSRAKLHRHYPRSFILRPSSFLAWSENTPFPTFLNYGRQGIGILSSCLPSSLVDLDVSDNPGMGEKGGFAIGRFLLDFVRSANLRRLEISGCQLRDAGLKSLAEGVAAAPRLEWLGVAGNLRSAGDEGGSGDGKMALGEDHRVPVKVGICFVGAKACIAVTSHGNKEAFTFTYTSRSVERQLRVLATSKRKINSRHCAPMV